MLLFLSLISLSPQATTQTFYILPVEFTQISHTKFLEKRVVRYTPSHHITLFHKHLDTHIHKKYMNIKMHTHTHSHTHTNTHTHTHTHTQTYFSATIYTGESAGGYPKNTAFALNDNQVSSPLLLFSLLFSSLFFPLPLSPLTYFPLFPQDYI